MAITYEIDTDACRVTITYKGKTTPEENLASYMAYLDDPAASPKHDYLVDLSKLTEIDSSFDRMQTMVSRLTPLYANRAVEALTAIFAPTDLAFGVARMYETLTSVQGVGNVMVFRERAGALDFLDRNVN